MVDIGGRSLYIDCRGSGSPTVVFEAGAGGDADAWGVVFPEIAAETRACVYNRAGLHRSDPDPRPGRTAGTIAADLVALLAAAGERPPYVLVGHSLGGVYTRVFADRHREDVVGLVLDDAFNPDLFEAQVAAAPERVHDRWRAGMEDAFRLIESLEGIDWDATAAELADASVDGVPLEVLVASRRSPDLSDEEAAAVDAARMASLPTLSSDTTVTHAEGAGHFIHLTRPQLVLDAIRRLVANRTSDPAVRPARPSSAAARTD
jgi:pimeloyl-ACP methyl ester carboxylesterase